jgi:hypothetical protein
MQDDRGIPPCLDLVKDKVLAIIQQSQLKTFLEKLLEYETVALHVLKLL